MRRRNFTKALCRAFCDSLVVSKVPIGYAVNTCFEADGGDALAFYLVRSDEPGKWRVEDDGATIANLDMAGVDVMASGPRSVAFADLIQSHDVKFDSEGVILHTEYVEESSLPRVALRFLSLLMRVQAQSMPNSGHPRVGVALSKTALFCGRAC